MGVDPLRFAEVDVSSALNNFGGWCNVPNYPNFSAFATLKSDGSIMAPEGPPAPPESGSPHAVIEPSVLRAAKATPVE
jgi:hypothetical protein